MKANLSVRRTQEDKDDGKKQKHDAKNIGERARHRALNEIGPTTKNVCVGVVVVVAAAVVVVVVVMAVVVLVVVVVTTGLETTRKSGMACEETYVVISRVWKQMPSCCTQMTPLLTV